MYDQDKRLVKRILRGEQKAFDEFFTDHYPRIYRYCRRRLPEADAEDVAVESMRQGLRRIETYRGEAQLITWLYQVARSQLSAHYKRQQKHRNLVLIEDDDAVRAEVEAMASELEAQPEQAREQQQRQHLIHYMLDSLPGNYGRVLHWKYIDGYSVDEIAERLTTSPTAIQSMLARARNAFRKTYDQINQQFEDGLEGNVVALDLPTGKTS